MMLWATIQSRITYVVFGAVCVLQFLMPNTGGETKESQSISLSFRISPCSVYGLCFFKVFTICLGFLKFYSDVIFFSVKKDKSMCVILFLVNQKNYICKHLEHRGPFKFKEEIYIFNKP